MQKNYPPKLTTSESEHQKEKQVRWIPKKLNLDRLQEVDRANITPVIESYGGHKVDPMEFIKDLYPPKYVESAGAVGHGYHGNPFAAFVTSPPAGMNAAGKYQRRQRTYNSIINSDYKTISRASIESRAYTKAVYISECGYIGGRRVKSAITHMYGCAIDLDYQTPDSLWHFLEPASSGNWYPMPTYIVFSGTGVHLWYLFLEPLDLYHGAKMGTLSKRYADLCKEQIIRRVWNPNTVIGSDDKGHVLGRVPQIQSIAQSYRMPGTPTKQMNLCTVYKMDAGRKYGDFDDIMSACTPVIPTTDDIDALFKALDIDKGYRPASGHGLDYWKQNSPDWYQSRIVEQKKPKKGHYTLQKRVYDWYLNQVKQQAAYGRRYWCMWSCVVFGRKCGVPRKQVEADLRDLMPVLDAVKPDHPMTENDLHDAMNIYTSQSTYYIRTSVIEAKTGITFTHAKRNHRTTEQHLTYARGVRALRRSMGESLTGTGRPQKKDIVQQWRSAHPDGTKAECIKATQLSKPTVYKWWTK